MKKTLVLYSTRDGHTRSIAKYIADELIDDVQCDLQDLQQAAALDMTAYDAVIIGASIRYGHFNRQLNRFIEQHIERLNQLPSAFYSVNLTARKAEKNTAQTNIYTRKFLQKIPWRPKLSAVFAGALYYPRYPWLDRVMIQLIMRITGGETDTSKEIDYTDWQQVKAFARQFAQLTGGNV